MRLARFFTALLIGIASVPVACGDDAPTPCEKVCSCVVKQLGPTSSSTCREQCKAVASAPDPVNGCKSRLTANGVYACGEACEAFGE